MTAPVFSRYRVQSIDILRGIVMVIMALDHVRDFFYKADVGNASAVATDPTNMATTYPALFFTRWITHFCAPVFVFLSGTSAFLMRGKKTKAQLSAFLITRGFWLVLVELFIITLGWTFDPLYHLFILQVIWAIGVSMIILGLLVYLPMPLIFLIGLIVVCGHNLLDHADVSAKLKGGALADLAYFGQFAAHPISDNRFFLVVYSFLPWTGIMLLGYSFGFVFTSRFDERRRRRILLLSGFSILILFFILRYTNIYGDPVPWSTQPRGATYTFLSFFNLNKYPPSLLFVCMTLGPAFILLAGLERMRNSFTNVMNVYGRVPMLYYIIHFFIIHTLLVILFYVTGHTAEQIRTPNNPFLFRPSDLGFGLVGVYLVWLFVVMVLYPVCKKYDRYKSSHTHWWLKYI
jgi:uncharacterized membrane protein